MILEFENLGPITRGSIDLNKKFIIFCGGNNTGKTYLSYLIYLLCYGYPTIKISNCKYLDNQIEKFKTEDKIKIDLVTLINENIDLLEKEFNHYINTKLKSYGTLDKNYLGDIVLKIKFTKIIEEEESILKNDSRGYYLGSFYSISKNRGSLHVDLEKLSKEENKTKENKTTFPSWPRVVQYINDSILNIIYTSFFPDSYFLTSERIGISVFKDELVYNRVRYLNQMIKMPDEERKKIQSTFQPFMDNLANYPLAILNSIQNSTRPENKNLQESINALAKELEEKLIKGEIIEVGGYTKLKLNNTIIDIPLSGSIVKSLTEFIKLLKEQNSWIYRQLFFDEPEMNLHPDNQIILARILAKFMNLNERLIVSTHSDYMLREFSNLMMMYLKKDNAQELMKRYNYSNKELINPAQVAVYYFKKNEDSTVTIQSLDVSKGEIDVVTINQTIQKQNDITQDIYYSLFEEKEDESNK